MPLVWVHPEENSPELCPGRYAVFGVTVCTHVGAVGFKERHFASFEGDPPRGPRGPCFCARREGYLLTHTVCPLSPFQDEEHSGDEGVHLVIRDQADPTDAFLQQVRQQPERV